MYLWGVNALQAGCAWECGTGNPNRVFETETVNDILIDFLDLCIKKM
jgi:hypothetical protein